MLVKAPPPPPPPPPSAYTHAIVTDTKYMCFTPVTTLKFDTRVDKRYSQNISTLKILAALYRYASVMQYIHRLLSMNN